MERQRRSEKPVRRRRVKGGPVKPPPPSRGRLRAFQVGEGLPNITVMRSELQDMTDVLLGRTEPPLDAGYLTLFEVADAYFARASEMTMKIQEAEAEGAVLKGSGAYKFRTGELRTFMDMAKRAADLGSRRLAQEQLNFEQSRTGRTLGDTDYD